MSESLICWQKMTDAELPALKNLLLSWQAHSWIQIKLCLSSAISSMQHAAIRHRGADSFVTEVINRTVSHARYEMSFNEETRQRTKKQIAEISDI